VIEAVGTPVPDVVTGKMKQWRLDFTEIHDFKLPAPDRFWEGFPVNEDDIV
jgi:hypothetical protein